MFFLILRAGFGLRSIGFVFIKRILKRVSVMTKLSIPNFFLSPPQEYRDWTTLIPYGEPLPQVEMDDYHEMLAYFRRHGLFHSVLIDDNGRILAGERKLIQLLKLKPEKVPVCILSDFSSVQRTACREVYAMAEAGNE